MKLKNKQMYICVFMRIKSHVTSTILKSFINLLRFQFEDLKKRPNDIIKPTLNYLLLQFSRL